MDADVRAALQRIINNQTEISKRLTRLETLENPKITPSGSGGALTIDSINVGSATGAATGQIKTSDAIAVGGSAIITVGLNVGSASGAAAGEGKFSGAVYPGAPTPASRLQVYGISALANNGIAALMSDQAAGIGLVFVVATTDGALSIFYINGAGHTTTEVSDPFAIFSVTAGTATSTNIYWSVGNARYELENKRGGARSYEILFFGS